MFSLFYLEAPNLIFKSSLYLKHKEYICSLIFLLFALLIYAYLILNSEG